MKRLACLAALIAVLGGHSPARAQAITQDDVVSARLLPGWRTADGTYMAALQLTLAPDWKTYWRSPGDAGIPPSFNWSGSQNLGAVRLHWPRPQVFHLNGMQSIGYKHDLVLPIELTPKDPAQPIALRGKVDLGVCRDICMPAALNVAGRIGGPGRPDPVIDAALAARPATAAEAGLTRIGCTVAPTADGLRLTAVMALPPTGAGETVIFEPGGPVWVSEAKVIRSAGTLTASADLVADDGGPIALNRSAVIVTVLGADRAVEISGCPAP